MPDPTAARTRHAADRRRTDIQRAGGHGHRIFWGPGPIVHRIAGRCDHHRHPWQCQDHRRHAGAVALGTGPGSDCSCCRLSRCQSGQQGRHHTRPRWFRHHRRRPGCRTACRRLRDLHRCRRYLHRRPAHRAQRPPPRHRQLRGDARDGGVRGQGADVAVRGVRPSLQRSYSCPVVVLGQTRHDRHWIN